VHGIIEIAAGPNVGAGLRPARSSSNPESLIGETDSKPARSSSNPESLIGGTDSTPVRSSCIPVASLSEIIRAFKAFSSRTINQKHPDGLFQWQRSFHDRVIRDKGELTAIGRYINENPRHWSADEENLNVGAGLRPARTLNPEEL